MPHTVVLVGSLDTKPSEYAFVRDRLNAQGIATTIIDIGVLGAAGISADFDREQVAAAGGTPLEELVAASDRGEALRIMAVGATAIVTELFAAGKLDGALALGGTGGTSVAAAVFRTLPVGVPKLIVSTAASGNTEAYIGESDLILMPSIVDIAGLNRISIPILANAAAAMAGMVSETAELPEPTRKLVAATMFGVTTPCVMHARDLLEALGYEVITFHMTGSGGRALESLIRQGYFAGVLDVTTTELADNLVGGVFDAGPTRLTAAGELGVPQVISVGALDMVNFGAHDTVPEQFSDRTLYRHNASVTLMRTTADENARLGAELAAKAAASVGSTTVFLPLTGVSAIDVEGGPFWDPEADSRLFQAIRDGLSASPVEIIEIDTDINDPAFAEAMVAALHAAITS